MSKATVRCMPRSPRFCVVCPNNASGWGLLTPENVELSILGNPFPLCQDCAARLGKQLIDAATPSQ